MDTANALQPISYAFDEQQLVTFATATTACVNITGWTVSRVDDFATTDPAQKLSCLYRYNKRITLNAAIARLDRYANRVRATRIPDKRGVFPTGLTDTLPPLADQRFRKQVGQLSFSAPSSPSQVWLTVVDSAPTNNGSGNTGVATSNNHGEAMANLSRDLLCRGIFKGNLLLVPKCPVTVRSRLALPRVAGSKALRISYGSLLDLAVALNDELNEWERSGTLAKRPRLVLNLSIGWHPSIQSTPDSGAAGQVYRQLVRARCQRAEILVAAGNLGGADGRQHLDEGLLLPAGWMKLPASPDVCESYGYPTKVLPTSGVPLLYAVSASGGDGGPLALTRPGGLSGLIAPGDHAVPHDASGAAYSPLTGTSVSTIVASSSFAAMLYDNPELSPAALWSSLLEIPNPVTLDGAPLSTELNASNSSDLIAALSPVQRVALCFLDTQPSPVRGYSCAARPNASAPLDAESDPITATFEYQTTQGQLGADAFWCPSGALNKELSDFGLSVCNDDNKLDASSNDAGRLQKLYPDISAQFWIHPQPIWSDCPACMISVRDGVLELFLHGTAAFGTETDTQLEVDYRTATGNRLTDVIPLKQWSHATTVSLSLEGNFVFLNAGNRVTGARLVHRHGDTVNVSALLLDASLTQ